MRLPPPWTSTTGRRRATCGDLGEDLLLLGEGGAAELDDDDLAHVVYSEFSFT